LGVGRVTEADGRQGGAGRSKLRFVLAQLRDVLAAEDSAIVPEEDDDRRLLRPQEAEPDLPAFRVREADRGQSLRQVQRHAATSTRVSL
jgi:hypothetical protein